MAGRRALIESFKSARRAIQDDRALMDATLRAQAGTRLYLPGFEAILPERRSDGLPIEVVEDTTFHRAGMLAEAGLRVGALNFANPWEAGGGVLRCAMAQEECLCRSSNLYECLTIPYILNNYYRPNARADDDMGTDSVIYSPEVTVFRSDDALPQPLEKPFRVDVLTCGAPYIERRYLERPEARERLSAVILGRIRNILDVAAANGVDGLVLGAFGCGAFNNPPEVVAEAFRRALIDMDYRSFFRRVVFAIKANDRANTNYRAFAEAFATENKEH